VLLKINGRLHDALSAFDSRKEAIINLKVDVKKRGLRSEEGSAMSAWETASKVMSKQAGAVNID